MNKKQINNQSKRNIILLYVLALVVLVVLFFAVKWSIESILFKDFFKDYQF